MIAAQRRIPEIVRAASEAFKNVDNLTVLNGAQGMGEIMAQVIGQAGPALTLARDTLGVGANGGAPSRRRRRTVGRRSSGAVAGEQRH